MCWPNRSVLNKWLRAPPDAAADADAPSLALALGRFEADTGPCARVNVVEVALGIFRWVGWELMLTDVKFAMLVGR
jgi:hypothetical protein